MDNSGIKMAKMTPANHFSHLSINYILRRKYQLCVDMANATLPPISITSFNRLCGINGRVRLIINLFIKSHKHILP